MPYEVCQRQGCGHPSEVIVVVVMVSLVTADELPPVQLALCAGHADQVALLAADTDGS